MNIIRISFLLLLCSALKTVDARQSHKNYRLLTNRPQSVGKHENIMAQGRFSTALIKKFNALKGTITQATPSTATFTFTSPTGYTPIYTDGSHISTDATAPQTVINTPTRPEASNTDINTEIQTDTGAAAPAEPEPIPATVRDFINNYQDYEDTDDDNNDDDDDDNDDDAGNTVEHVNRANILWNEINDGHDDDNENDVSNSFENQIGRASRARPSSKRRNVRRRNYPVNRQQQQTHRQEQSDRRRRINRSDNKKKRRNQIHKRNSEKRRRTRINNIRRFQKFLKRNGNTRVIRINV